jgi:simple sugar transport system substrate-binding protein
MTKAWNGRTDRRTILKGAGGFAVAAALGSSLSACQSDASGGDKMIDFNNKSLEIFFYQVLLESVKRATEEAGRSFSTSDANNDASAQFSNWETTLIKRPEFIITNPVDSANLIPLTERSSNMGIPVGVIDTPLTGGEAAFTIAFNNYDGGVLAAEETVKALKAKYGSERGTVLNCYGTLQSSALRDRRDGFDETIRKYPEITLLSRPTEESEEQTRSLVTSTLGEYPDLDAIHTPTDSLTRPAMLSMRAANALVPIGQDGHVILTSIDGGPDSLGWLSDRVLDAEIAQDPVAYGMICVEMLVKYAAEDESVPLGPYDNKDYFWEKAEVIEGDAGPQMVLPAYVITEENAADPRQWGNVVTKKWGMSES